MWLHFISFVTKKYDDLTLSSPFSDLKLAVFLDFSSRQLQTRVTLNAGLHPTSHDMSWQQLCTTCVCVLKALFNFKKIHIMSNAGKVLRVASNSTTCSITCVGGPYQFFWIPLLRAYFPGSDIWESNPICSRNFRLSV